MLIASSWAGADEASPPWVIKADISDDIDEFVANSPIVQEMRINNEPNNMVYAVDVDQAPMPPVSSPQPALLTPQVSEVNSEAKSLNVN